MLGASGPTLPSTVTLQLLFSVCVSVKLVVLSTTFCVLIYVTYVHSLCVCVYFMLNYFIFQYYVCF